MGKIFESPEAKAARKARGAARQAEIWAKHDRRQTSIRARRKRSVEKSQPLIGQPNAQVMSILTDRENEALQRALRDTIRTGARASKWAKWAAYMDVFGAFRGR